LLIREIDIPRRGDGQPAEKALVELQPRGAVNPAGLAAVRERLAH